MTGKSRAPHPKRRIWYKRQIYVRGSHRYTSPHEYLVLSSLNNLGKSMFDKIVSKGIKIEGLIYLHLKNSGLIKLKADGSIDYDNLDHGAINVAIKKRFKFTFKKLYFSDSALSSAEINRAL